MFLPPTLVETLTGSGDGSGAVGGPNQIGWDAQVRRRAGAGDLKPEGEEIKLASNTAHMVKSGEMFDRPTHLPPSGLEAWHLDRICRMCRPTSREHARVVHQLVEVRRHHHR